jgi:hypothetical protein
MPYIFINDGNPEAVDYDSSYLYYDDRDIDQMRRVLEILDQRAYADPSHRAYIAKMLERALKREHHSLVEEQRRHPRDKKDLKQIVSTLLNRIGLPSTQ